VVLIVSLNFEELKTRIVYPDYCIAAVMQLAFVILEAVYRCRLCVYGALVLSLHNC